MANAVNQTAAEWKRLFGVRHLFLGLGSDFGIPLFLVLQEYRLLHSNPGDGIQGMGDVLVGTVLPSLGGHGDKKAGAPMNDLQISDHEAIVQGDRHVGLQLFLVYWKYPDIRYLHRKPPLRTRTFEELLAGSVRPLQKTREQFMPSTSQAKTNCARNAKWQLTTPQ